MIEPVIDALTTVSRPGLQGEEGDDQLGDVAERRVEDAADLRAGERAETLGREADDPRQPQDRDRADTNTAAPSTCRTKSSTMASDRHGKGREDDDPGGHREHAEDGDAGPGGGGMRHGANPSGDRRGHGLAGDVERPGAGAGRGGDPLRGLAASDAARRPAAGPRSAREPRVASSADAATRPPPRPLPRAPADHEHELAARRDRAVRSGRAPARRAGPRVTVSWSFVSSRQTAPGRSGAAGRGQVAQRRGDAVRRLEQHAPALVRGDRRQPLPPLAARSGQEPLERPARPGEPRRRHRRQHGRGARASARPRRRPRPTRPPGPRRDRRPRACPRR